MAAGSIRVLLWDCGGVLLTNGWDRRERAAVLQQFSLDAAEFEPRHPEANDQWERDAISVEEYLQHTVFYASRSFTAQQFVAAMQAQSAVLHPDNLRLARELAATGRYTLALLNNEARVLNDHRIAAFGLKKIFSSFFSSCYLGLRKPEPAIFRRVLDILQCAPGEALFIDDRNENVEAARALGMQAIQMLSPAQLRSEMQRLGMMAA
jgi:putative hydrolase of the HAD superfamily